MTDLINITSENLYLLVGSVLLLAGIMAGRIGSRVGVPALLFFLLTGMFFGSSGLGLQYSDTVRTQFFGTVALAIILFFGGFETKLSEIRPVLSQGLLLSTVGVLLTTALLGGFLYLLGFSTLFSIHLSLPIALLLAATMSSTDSASVFGVLRSSNLNLKENLRPMLELESGSNDPMAYMLTIALIQFVTGDGGGSWWMILTTFVLQFSVGSLTGYFGGKWVARLLNHVSIDNTALYPITLLCLIFLLFALTSILGGNGFLAVYIMGVVIGNRKLVHRRTIETFFDALTWLVQILLFIILGLYVDAKSLLPVIPFALLAGLFMIFVARPVAVHLCMSLFPKLSLNGRHFLSWVGLRGAVPIIFATYPLMSEVEGADTLFNIVFVITLLSLLIQGSTIPFVARRLSLGEVVIEEESRFGVEIPQHTGAQMEEREVTAEMLSEGNRIMHLDLKEDELVMLVHRGQDYIVPKGKLELQVGDLLLIVSEDNHLRGDTPHRSKAKIDTFVEANCTKKPKLSADAQPKE